MASSTFNLTRDYSIERGACFSYTLDIDVPTGEYDLSTSSLSGYLYRKWDGKSGPNFTATILVPESGTAMMELSATETSSLSADEYYHEVYVYPSGQCPIRLIQGDAEVWGGGSK